MTTKLIKRTTVDKKPRGYLAKVILIKKSIPRIRKCKLQIDPMDLTDCRTKQQNPKGNQYTRKKEN